MSRRLLAKDSSWFHHCEAWLLSPWSRDVEHAALCERQGAEGPSAAGRLARRRLVADCRRPTRLHASPSQPWDCGRHAVVAGGADAGRGAAPLWALWGVLSSLGRTSCRGTWHHFSMSSFSWRLEMSCVGVQCILLPGRRVPVRRCQPLPATPGARGACLGRLRGLLVQCHHSLAHA
jgi:hypothetical protein